MGMYDSLYDADGQEWQTKAYDCYLEKYRVGDRMPGGAADYQVEILGGPENRHGLATIRRGVLVEIDAARDRTLFLLSYGGGVGSDE